MKKLRIVILIINLILFGICFPISAQMISDVPPTVANDRYFNEIFPELKRPGISIVGFDNNGDNSKGYGLKQVLEQVYIVDPNSNESKDLFKEVLKIADDNIDTSPANDDVIEENSNILQYLAFEALASFVLEQNGVSAQTSGQTYGIPIRDHQTVINSFTGDLMALVNANKLTDPGGDYVKNVDTYMNIARAIDLYLALENAYTKWPGVSGNTSWLLSQPEKQQLTERFISDLNNLHGNHVHKSIAKIAGVDVTGVTEDEVEPGNRPFKGWLALGYGALAVQNGTDWLHPYLYLFTAISKGSDPASGSERTLYWNYQTSNAQPYWAEGPYYFNFAMLNVVPFWHAVRANNMLGSVSDPFNSNWFLNPVDWLANISTPDGLTPPLDDGNKHRINASAMLRWSGEYGRAGIGKKFNTIYERLKIENDQSNTPAKYRLSNNTYLMELALPKAAVSTAIDYDVFHSNYQQRVVRQQDGNGSTHYVLLNGESGNAITRGEGHEQPDQQQLLYYVDDVSYLIDSGYDRPTTDESFFAWLGGDQWTRSTWNNYYDHNVMTDGYYYIDEDYKGGLPRRQSELNRNIPPLNF